MFSVYSLRDVSFVTLFVFTAGCTFISGGSYPSQGRYPASAPQRGPSKPRPDANRPSPGKPAQQPAKPQPRPKPQPSPQPRPKPKPDPKPAPDPKGPVGTQIVVPVRVDFAAAVAQIDARIQKTMNHDWQTVSASGAAIKVEARYKVWRDPVRASFDDGALKIRVDVHYAADVRASAKNPFGGGRIWITKGISWGTQASPQKLIARFTARIDINSDYSVEADARLTDIDHGVAPKGEVCVKSAVKLCVTKEALAPMVHKKLEAALVPQVQKALGSADKQLEKSLNLKRHAQQLWTNLQQPLQLQQLGQTNCPSELGGLCSTPAWLLVQPATIGISGPHLDRKDLRVDLGFGGQLVVKQGNKPAVKPTPLPRLQTSVGRPGFAVRASLRIPTDALGDELTKHLKGQNLGGVGTGNAVIAGVTLEKSSNPRFPRRIQATISVRGGVDADVKVHGDLEWDGRKDQLSLENIDYVVESANPALKQLSAANKAALLKVLADRAHWNLDTKSSALKRAITRALGGVWPGHLKVHGELSNLEIERFTVDKDKIAADVLVTGQLDVALTP